MSSTSHPFPAFDSEDGQLVDEIVIDSGLPAGLFDLGDGRTVAVEPIVCTNLECRCTRSPLRFYLMPGRELYEGIVGTVDMRTGRPEVSARDDSEDVLERVRSELESPDRQEWMSRRVSRIRGRLGDPRFRDDPRFRPRNLVREYLVEYQEAFPREFHLLLKDDEQGFVLLNDAYCLRAECHCNAVTVSFLGMNSDEVLGAVTASVGAWEMFETSGGPPAELSRLWFKAVARYGSKLLERAEAMRAIAIPAEVRVEKTPRNASCPCGSGKKYKRCCGRSS